VLKIVADDPLLQELNIDDFLAYLRDTNWKHVEYPNDRLVVYEKYEYGDKEPETLALPRYHTFSDSYARLADAINLLSEIEGLPPHALIQKILSTDRDTLSMRMLLPPGSFPSLEKATQIVHGLRDLIAFSACMETEPKPFFNKQLPEGQQQAQLCRFGHTFTGSFGFTIESPIFSLQPQLFETPLSRRAVERIIRGLNFAHQAEQEQNWALISQTFERGLNSNMCNALADISMNLENIDFEYTISWSPRFPPSYDLREIRTIHLSGSTYHFLTEAAAFLKKETIETSLVTALEGRAETEVSGTIIQLKSGKKDDRAISVQMGDRVIHISLDRETYQLACNAHRDGLPIAVSGKLTKRGRSWYLENPHSFFVENHHESRDESIK
jgi:hypothetical protein